MYSRISSAQKKIGRLLAKFAIPGIISMVVNSLYNIIDQIFIGQGVGYLGNGATSVIFSDDGFLQWHSHFCSATVRQVL